MIGGITLFYTGRNRLREICNPQVQKATRGRDRIQSSPDFLVEPFHCAVIQKRKVLSIFVVHEKGGKKREI